jgi:hypothetical protein
MPIRVAAILILMVLSCGRESIPSPNADGIPVWRIAAEPMVTIGGEEESVDPLYQVGGAAEVRSGYLIAHRSGHELRLYDEGGRLKTRIGREGQGPAEFRNPRIVGRLPADSIVVYDLTNRRISIVCEDHVCEEWPLRHPGRVVGMSGGRVVVEYAVPAAPTMGESRGVQMYVALSRDGSVADTILTLAGQPRYTGGSGNATMVVPVFLTRGPQAAVSTEFIAVANGHDAAVQIFSPKTLEPKAIQLPIPEKPVTAEEFSKAADAFLAAATRAAPPELEAVVRAMEAPATMPPLRRMLSDASGWLWIELDERNVDVQSWLVIDMTGEVRARLRLPAGLELLEIDVRKVIGLWRDSLGVEYVRVHALDRG